MSTVIPNAPEPSHQAARNYAFDHLKATMMIGVVVAHSGLTYMVLKAGKIWPAKDPQHISLVFDLLVSYLACITMPVFFVVSGFVTAMLIDKRGWRQMLKNRLTRILYPLLISMITLVPLTAAAFNYFEFKKSNMGSSFIDALIKLLNEGVGSLQLKLLHLWFLYCLVVFCVVGIIIYQLMKKFFPKLAYQVIRAFSFIYHLKSAPVLFAIPTFLLLSLRKVSIIETPTTLMTDTSILASHAVFFFFGWLLFYDKDILRFKKNDWLFCILGLCFFLVKLVIYQTLGETGTANYLLAAANALFVWMLVFAHLGLFIRYFDGYSKIGRYLSDASYWIYLVHLPIVLTLQASLVHTSLNAYFKFLIVLFFTFLITIVTYNYLVRNTLIGTLLNGRRYKRGLPE